MGAKITVASCSGSGKTKVGDIIAHEHDWPA
jgi:hypothetical protein